MNMIDNASSHAEAAQMGYNKIINKEDVVFSVLESGTMQGFDVDLEKNKPIGVTANKDVEIDKAGIILLRDYAIYVEAKIEINEIPLDFQQWQEFNRFGAIESI